jgi:hypothetical protein
MVQVVEPLIQFRFTAGIEGRRNRVRLTASRQVVGEQFSKQPGPRRRRTGSNRLN